MVMNIRKIADIVEIADWQALKAAQAEERAKAREREQELERKALELEVRTPVPPRTSHTRVR